MWQRHTKAKRICQREVVIVRLAHKVKFKGLECMEKNGGPRKQKPWKAKLTYVPNSIYALEMVPKRFITSVQ